MRWMIAASMSLAGLTLATPAHAGGIGLLLNGGAHTDKQFFYSSHSLEGAPIPYESLDDYDQYELNQILPHFGGGVEFMLGDRDDKILGKTRIAYMMDAPQGNPADVSDEVPAEYVVAAPRDKARHVGIASIGLTWGIVGSPSGFMLNAVGHVGSGFITTDHTEFLLVDLGPGVTYKVARQVQLFGDLSYQMRQRKGFVHGGALTVGARYMFD